MLNIPKANHTRLNHKSEVLKPLAYFNKSILLECYSKINKNLYIFSFEFYGTRVPLFISRHFIRLKIFFIKKNLLLK
jgi:hypothetical protein